MQPHTPEIIDSSGRQLILGSVLGKGGEGAVYEINGSSSVVAKIYHSPISKERAAKIQLLKSVSNDSVKSLAAWPIDLVLQARSREPVGLLIPKVSGRKDIHQLYGPKSRQTEFPRADWRFLIRSAANTARAFAAVHSTGCVIGDVNEGSVLVAQDATVRLIDCDSFQIVANGKRYACEVGVESFTPPELQGLTLREVVRTTNHDSFGLGVMIFLLLFMGRHPFAGRFLGQGDMPIQKAIKEVRFAYGSMRASFQMEKPPGTPSLGIVGDEVAFLFERTFAKQMMAGGRPEPLEWIQALTNLEKNLKQCAANPAHWHLTKSSCPWCPMEAATGSNLFPYVAIGKDASLIDVLSIWRQIESLPNLGPAPSILIPPPKPTEDAKKVGGSYFQANLLALGLALFVGAVGLFGGLAAPAPALLLMLAFLGFFGARKFFDKSSEVYRYRTQHDQANNQWTHILQEWELKAGSKDFDFKKVEMARVRDEYNGLPHAKAKKLDKLKNSLRQSQLMHYLDNFEIERASIDGIGNGRKRTLESYGIETAADLVSKKVESVPGFGPRLCANLYQWRRSLEARFVFDASKGLDPRDVQKIELEFAAERKRLEQRLLAGLAELRAINSRVNMARSQMRPTVEAACLTYMQAIADYKAASGGSV